MKNTGSIKLIAAPILKNSKITHAFLTKEGLPDIKERYSVQTVNQVHGDNIMVVDKNQPVDKNVCADAIITNLKGVPIGILTADCLPVILFDPLNTAVGIIHAGWKGTLKRIVSKTVLAMHKKWGTSPDQITAGLGPCIGECCYAVGTDVIERFMAEFSDSMDFIMARENARHLNLKKANYNQLVSAGLLKKNIWISKLCTSCRKDLFFSYRRDNKETGRQMSFVMIR